MVDAGVGETDPYRRGGNSPASTACSVAPSLRLNSSAWNWALTASVLSSRGCGHCASARAPVRSTIALNALSSSTRSRSAAKTSVIQTSAPLFDAATQNVQRGAASASAGRPIAIATIAIDWRMTPPLSREPPHAQSRRQSLTEGKAPCRPRPLEPISPRNRFHVGRRPQTAPAPKRLRPPCRGDAVCDQRRLAGHLVRAAAAAGSNGAAGGQGAAVRLCVRREPQLYPA